MNEKAYTSLRFSTRELPTPKRLPALQQLFDQAIKLKLDAAPGQVVEMDMLVAPGLRRARMLSGLTARIARPAPMLADGEDTVCLMIKAGGRMRLAQRKRESIPEVGDGVLLVYREPALLDFDDATYVSIRVPFRAIAPLAHIEEAAACCIPRETEALRLLQTYVAHLPERIADADLARLAAGHVYDLLALAIGATRDGRDLAQHRSVRAARLEAIKADVRDNPSLDVSEAAARQGVSARYVQLLFEEIGTTFSLYVLAQRLDKARSMLTSPRHAHRSIADIAMDAGFGDLSHFNRRFKQRFHMTPSELRRAEH